MHNAIGIRVAAPAERVFELAADVSAWPELLPHYRRVTVQGRRRGRLLAQMVATRRFGPLPVPVTWRAEQWAEGSDPADLRLHFRHVRGFTHGMAVTWHIQPAPDGCHVRIEHDFRRRLPFLGEELLPQVVDRLFTRSIASQTLRTFRRLAEERQSAAPQRTNQIP